VPAYPAGTMLAEPGGKLEEPSSSEPAAASSPPDPTGAPLPLPDAPARPLDALPLDPSPLPAPGDPLAEPAPPPAKPLPPLAPLSPLALVEPEVPCPEDDELPEPPGEEEPEPPCPNEPVEELHAAKAKTRNGIELDFITAYLPSIGRYSTKRPGDLPSLKLAAKTTPSGESRLGQEGASRLQPGRMGRRETAA
jgi:hypothetical protein